MIYLGDGVTHDSGRCSLGVVVFISGTFLRADGIDGVTVTPNSGRCSLGVIVLMTSHCGVTHDSGRCSLGVKVLISGTLLRADEINVLVITIVTSNSAMSSLRVLGFLLGLLVITATLAGAGIPSGIIAATEALLFSSAVVVTASSDSGFLWGYSS